MRQFCGRYLPCQERHGIMVVNKEVKSRERSLLEDTGMGCASWQTIETQEEHLCQS